MLYGWKKHFFADEKGAQETASKRAEVKRLSHSFGHE